MISNTSDIHNQVMWNRLISVVEEQALTLIRTAFSTSVREAGDLSAGVFDEQGRMIAQAVTGTPGHVNSMAEAVGHFMDALGVETMREGDVYITNDPWKGTGHLHDITVVSPVFRKQKLIGFFACTAHVVDIGGRGFGPDANEVYEEGLFIPIMHFATEGVVNKDLINIVRNNVREADQVVGDLHALASCNEIGDRRLNEMMDEFNLDNLDDLGEYILHHSKVATLAKIADLPKGSFTNEMTVDGHEKQITMKVRLTISDDSVLADFDGTTETSKFGINVPLIYTKAYSCYGLKCAIAPEIPNNAASLAPFDAIAPKGSILNAQRPSPVSVRHVLGHFIPDVVLGALHKFLPDRIPAEGAGTTWNIQIGVQPIGNTEEDKSNQILMFNSGGGGARPSVDGLNATAFPSGIHTMPVEATEQVGPIIVWRKQLREGSGGAGKYRGGLGQEVEISAADGYSMSFNAMFDRILNPAIGRMGGQAGLAGDVSLNDGTKLKGKASRVPVPVGKRVCLTLPGGGGFGNPLEREKERIEHDLKNGYITESEAVDVYGLKS